MRAPAPAKINLALVVGPLRDDGKHELLTLYQRVGLSDRIDLVVDESTTVAGFAGDTLVRDGLDRLAAHTGTGRRWRTHIEKRIPVAGGLGGGSSDAATALRLANETLDEPLPLTDLHALARGLGADVPFFLHDGPQLGAADGTELSPVDVPQDFWVVLALPQGAHKPSTADVYRAFDARSGADGWEDRRARLLDGVAALRRPRDLAALPPNDLASSPFAEELRRVGAFRADVSGAGPVVYGLFHHRRDAEAARHAVRRGARTWLTAPAWYG
jgi:4-diphosphocytidyl-2-C-methyl-D-erythritol kinase